MTAQLHSPTVARVLSKIAFAIWCVILAGAMIWARTRGPEQEPPTRALFEERHRMSYDSFAASDDAQAYDLLAAAFAGKELDRQFGFYAKAARQLVDAGAAVTVWDLTYQDFKLLEMRGETCRVRSKWTVFYVLGHARHSHIRGNAYEAIFDLRKTDGGWRIVRSEIVGENNLA